MRRTWDSLAVRERRLVAMAAALLLAVLLWMIGIAPAVNTVRSAPARLDALDLQLQAMQKLAAQARALQGRASVGREDAVRALESSTQQRLGASAQFSVTGDRAVVTVRGAAPDVLAQWLSQVRAVARVTPGKASLTRGSSGWDGSMVFDLPPAAL
jgi:general secretion pathway protein M